MYILLTENSSVSEIIPDINPIFPGVPIEERYAPDFVAQLLSVADNVEVKQNWVYSPETGEFSPPVAESPEDMISSASSEDNLPADTNA